ncbi:MAG: amidohydrolase family protein [Terracidiphilus sp.]|nr:amidohydrolase family protein [Terracidiphilus sp.]
MQMIRDLAVGLLAAGLASVAAWPQAQAPALPKTAAPATAAAPAPLVLAGGTVVDVSDWGHSAKDLQDAIVIVRDGRVSEVGSRYAVTIPKGARVIDCAGKFLIPGLVDGFAGMNSQGQASADLYMGVTTVVGSSDDRRGSIDFAANPSPHLYLLDSIGSTDDWSLLAKRPEWAAKLKEGAHPAELSPDDTARQLADTAKLGTRALWLGHNLTAANTQWIIAHAHQLGLVTYGEFVSTPYKVGIEAGVDVLLHMSRYELGVIPDELQRPLVDDPQGAAANTAYDYSERFPATDVHVLDYAKFLATHHAALMPTFSLFYPSLPGHRNLWKEPAAALLDPARMFAPADRSTGEFNYPLAPWTRRLPGVAQRYLEEGQRKKADQAAMRLWRINETIFSAFPHYLAASGAPVFGSMPGISMHIELELLVRLGLSPREALAAASNNYALQFGWTELGQIAPGRRADILVVDGDPTANVWNARRISGLIVDGNVIDREALLINKK